MRLGKLGVVGIVLGLLVACSTSSPPRIDQASPNPTQQSKTLWLFGGGFGEYQEGRSAVFFAGTCAEVMSWEDAAVAVSVPTGIGTGVRELELRRADGERAVAVVSIDGTDLPPPLFRPCAQQLADWDAVSELDDDRTELDAPDGWDEPDWDEPDWDEPDWLDWDQPDGDEPVGDYRYVLIVDISYNDVGRNPGVDLDAVCLLQSGRRSCAEQVEVYENLPGVGENLDFNQALGFPDAYYAWPDLSVCLVWEASVVLGGEGYIILRMSNAMQAGDELEVYEVGNCDYGGGKALNEDYLVMVGRSPGIWDDWTVLGVGAGAMTFRLPLLP